MDLGNLRQNSLEVQMRGISVSSKHMHNRPQMGCGTVADPEGVMNSPSPVENRHKKMTAEAGSIDFPFLIAPPLDPLLLVAVV